MIRGRTCPDGGLLVEAKNRLPSDPCEYYRRGAGILVGCNRLRCARCDQWVRSQPYLALEEDVPRDIAALYVSDSWSELPFVYKSRGLRLYACRCTAWEESYNHEIENDHESPKDPNVPWACQGHPVPELPITLGELTIAADTDWAQLVAKILDGACPRRLETPHWDEGPASWLSWLYAYLADLPIAEQLSAAIAERIADPDPLVVGRVLHFFFRFPRATGVERVIADAETHVDRVAVGHPIPEYLSPPTLWDVIVARLEQRTKQRDALDQRVTDLLRKVLLIPLTSLSHEDLGPTDLVELERQRRKRRGDDVDSELGKQRLTEYGQMKKRERVDVVVNTFERANTVFDDVELREWIADHIVELDAAAKGRWRHFMNVLTDRYKKPETGHLIVVAGMSLIQSGTIGADEFREWMKWRRANYGWMDDAWVSTLETVLEQKSQTPPVN